MNKKVIFFAVLIVVSLASVPVFAGVSIDIGASVLGNDYYYDTRPLGAITSLGVTLYDGKAIVQLTGGFFSPPLSGDYEDPAASIGAGVLFSPMEYLYLGFRTSMIVPLDDKSDPSSQGSIVLRVQKPGKGIHFFAETEVGLLGYLNRFSAGVNFTL